MPGTSGILSPFSKIKGLYFNNDGEPDSFLVDFMKDLNRVFKEEGKDAIMVEFETKEDYYDVMCYVEHFLDDDIRVYAVDRNAPTVIFEKEPDMVAEHETGIIDSEEYEDGVEE